MKRILYIIIAIAGLALAACKPSQTIADAEQKIIVKSPATDSLSITFPEGYEGELCHIEIQHLYVNLVGNEQVFSGKVHFDIRRFPPGNYSVYIRVGDLAVIRHFTKVVGRYQDWR